MEQTAYEKKKKNLKTLKLIEITFHRIYFINKDIRPSVFFSLGETIRSIAFNSTARW